MASINYEFDLIAGDDMTPTQEEFINHWSQFYFGNVAVSRGLAQAPVHWRLILRDGADLLSQVGVTELDLKIDGHLQRAGALGALFTPTNLKKNGYGNALLDHAEEFIFGTLNLPMGILFCLPELVPFYARRSWSLITQPVTLEQKSGVTTWAAAAMVLFQNRVQSGDHVIHMPIQTRKDRGARRGETATGIADGNKP